MIPGRTRAAPGAVRSPRRRHPPGWRGPGELHQRRISLADIEEHDPQRAAGGGVTSAAQAGPATMSAAAAAMNASAARTRTERSPGYDDDAGRRSRPPAATTVAPRRPASTRGRGRSTRRTRRCQGGHVSEAPARAAAARLAVESTSAAKTRPAGSSSWESRRSSAAGLRTSPGRIAWPRSASSPPPQPSWSTAGSAGTEAPGGVRVRPSRMRLGQRAATDRMPSVAPNDSRKPGSNSDHGRAGNPERASDGNDVQRAGSDDRGRARTR